MKNSITSKVIEGIGVLVIVSSFIGANIIGSETSNEIIPLALFISGFISGITFIGFGKIIDLLQKSVNTQNEILHHIKTKTVDEQYTSKTIIQDIEENLPNI